MHDNLTGPHVEKTLAHDLAEMLTAVHTLVYSDDPGSTRAFFRDVLDWPHVEHPESEPGWLIVKTGPSELGVHPTSGTHQGGNYSYPRHHSISLMCDDVRATRAELEAKGATFSDEIQDLGFGLGTTLEVPGAGSFSTSRSTPKLTASNRRGTSLSREGGAVT